jgi:MFS family permease
MAISYLENYLRLFLRSDIARPVVAAFVARLRDGGTPLAMVLVTAQSTRSFMVAGLATGAFGLAAAVSRPVHGRLLDRRGHGVLAVTAAANSAAMLALALAARLGAPAVALVALAAVVGLMLPAQGAALRALLPALAGDRLRPAAYAVEANAQELSSIVGPLLVGVLAAAGGPGTALAALAAIGLVGTVWYTRAPATRHRPGTASVAARAGALRSRGMPALLLAVTAMGATIGLIQVALPAFADRHGATELAGVLLAAFAVGSLAGGTLYGARQWRWDAARQLRTILIALAASVALLAAPGGMLAMTALAALAGAGMAPAFAVSFLLCDDVSAPGSAGESFTWLGAANTAGFGLGGVLAGTVIEQAGQPAAFLAGGVLLVAVAAALPPRALRGPGGRLRPARNVEDLSCE